MVCLKFSKINKMFVKKIIIIVIDRSNALSCYSSALNTGGAYGSVGCNAPTMACYVRKVYYDFF